MIIRANTLTPPSEGLHQAILAAVVDLPDEKTDFNGEERMRSVVRFVWLIDELDKQGKNRIVCQKMTKSTHEKSTFYGVVKAMTGRIPGAEFNTDAVLGQNAGLILEHSKDGQFANVTKVLKADKKNCVVMPQGWDVPKRREGETVEVYNPYSSTNTDTSDGSEEEYAEGSL